MLNERQRQIQERLHIIQKSRREHMALVMEDYDKKVHYPRWDQIKEECETNGGHVWKFDGTNFLPWIARYVCEVCGAIEIEDTSLKKDDTN